MIKLLCILPSIKADKERFKILIRKLTVSDLQDLLMSSHVIIPSNLYLGRGQVLFGGHIPQVTSTVHYCTGIQSTLS